MSRRFSELIFGVQNAKKMQKGGTKKKSLKYKRRKSSKRKSKAVLKKKIAKGKSEKKKNSTQSVNHTRFVERNMKQVMLEREYN